MSNAQSAGLGQSHNGPLTPENYEAYMTWRMRWYLVIAITIAYILALIGGLIGFGMTKDPRYLLFIAPTALVPFVRYLVPMDQKQYELKMAQIHASKELSQARLEVQMLRAERGKQLNNESTGSRTKQQEQLLTM